MIKTIVFDFGGVIMTIDHPGAMARFASLGLKEPERHLDAYTQGGIFGALEGGKIGRDVFRRELSALCGRELSHEQCRWAWLGYAKEVPARNLMALRRLRREGFRLVMLSNTNPYMMSWAMSPEFSQGIDPQCPEGCPASDYFDATYFSYEVKAMKPDPRFFRHVLERERLVPAETLFLDDGPRNIAAAEALGIQTMQPENGADWTAALFQRLGIAE